MSLFDSDIFQITFPSHHETWIIGLSAGVDSVVLLSLCHKYNLQNNNRHTIVPVHLNHLTRGVDSDKDAQLCAKISHLYSYKVIQKRLDITKMARERNSNFEETARNERHQLFREVAKEYSAKTPAVLLAHHYNDQLETILMRLMRGSGLRGLRGIQSKSFLPRGEKSTNNKLPTFRPLLNVSKKTITKYAQDNNLEWREDKSNSDIKYTRNLIRQKILPALSIIDGDIESKLLNISKIGNRAEELITTAIKNIEYSQNEDSIRIDTVTARSAPQISFIRLVEDLCSRITGSQLLPRRSYKALKDLLQERVSATDLSKNVHIYEYHGSFYIYKKDVPAYNYDYTHRADGFKFETPIFTIQIKRAHLKDGITARTDPSTEYISTSFAEQNLRVGNIKVGQRVSPIGLGSSQKLSKIFNSKEIPCHLRRNIPIIYAGDIPIWIVGVTLCEAAKITDLTDEVFCLHYSEKTF